jgi:hypothetical protein
VGFAYNALDDGYHLSWYGKEDRTPTLAAASPAKGGATSARTSAERKCALGAREGACTEPKGECTT